MMSIPSFVNIGQTYRSVPAVQNRRDGVAKQPAHKSDDVNNRFQIKAHGVASKNHSSRNNRGVPKRELQNSKQNTFKLLSFKQFSGIHIKRQGLTIGTNSTI